MDQPANDRMKGISTGLFLAVFLIPFVLTYVVGWLSPFWASRQWVLRWLVLMPLAGLGWRQRRFSSSCTSA